MANNQKLTENEIAKIVIDRALKVHRRLGPGLLESVYEAALAFELIQTGLKVQRQLALPVRYENVSLDIGFRVDLLVNDLVIVELKSLQEMSAIHKKVVLTYLRVADKRLGLLINFGEALLKEGITRIANGMPE